MILPKYYLLFFLVPSNRNRAKQLYDGFLFVYEQPNKTNSGIHYWACENYRDYACRGRLVEKADGSFRASGKQHNHGRVHGKAEVQKWKIRAKEMARNNEPTRNIVTSMGGLSLVII